ncbi:unnamed protein product [Rangifer tarandus platyrhynchus]|uniref:Uncharacterized protein n=3 Tax=Rangifer tarandus platyrhynchus TaxID=3082113 RepID=A0ABN8ZYW5_RANTA|nr:unnamed protein product [Rangifer tarandus platyrhynchus]CAI9712126.1 unnamed protein product [Rangifer tarandus platyrhynchus]
MGRGLAEVGGGGAGGQNEELGVGTAPPADVAHPVVAGPLRQWSDIVPRGVAVKACRLLRAAPEFGGFQLSARVPFRKGDRQPPLHARPRLHPGTLAGEGDPARQVPAAHTLLGSPRRASGPGGEAARPKRPALGTAPGARRRPYLLEKGAPQPGPRESTPSASREGARHAAALCFPGAVARSGRARRAHPGLVNAARVPAGGAGWAAGARLPRLALGLPGAAQAARALRGPPPSGPAAASFPRARAPGPRLSALAAPRVPPPASPASRLAGQSKNRAHSSNFCVRTLPEAGQRDGNAGVAARSRGSRALARGCDLERAFPVSRPTRTKAIARTVAVVTRADE